MFKYKNDTINEIIENNFKGVISICKSVVLQIDSNQKDYKLYLKRTWCVVQKPLQNYVADHNI